MNVNTADGIMRQAPILEDLSYEEGQIAMACPDIKYSQLVSPVRHQVADDYRMGEDVSHAFTVGDGVGLVVVGTGGGGEELAVHGHKGVDLWLCLYEAEFGHVSDELLMIVASDVDC